MIFSALDDEYNLWASNGDGSNGDVLQIITFLIGKLVAECSLFPPERWPDT